jgi:transcriptional repressor NrdR
MKCPFCGKVENQVLESRVVEDGKAIRRRRECEKCRKRFTSYERVRETFLWVIKKEGSREPFEKEKLKRGILRAIHKRPVSLGSVDEIVEQVEREMLNKKEEEVSSRAIGGAVLRRLGRIDKVAWLRFASVYLNFEDLKDFEKAINK